MADREPAGQDRNYEFLLWQDGVELDQAGNQVEEWSKNVNLGRIVEYTNTKHRTRWRDEIRTFAGAGWIACNRQRTSWRGEITTFTWERWSTIT